VSSTDVIETRRWHCAHRLERPAVLLVLTDRSSRSSGVTQDGREPSPVGPGTSTQATMRFRAAVSEPARPPPTGGSPAAGHARSAGGRVARGLGIGETGHRGAAAVPGLRAVAATWMPRTGQGGTRAVTRRLRPCRHGRTRAASRPRGPVAAHAAGRGETPPVTKEPHASRRYL